MKKEVDDISQVDKLSREHELYLEKPEAEIETKHIEWCEVQDNLGGGATNQNRSVRQGGLVLLMELMNDGVDRGHD